MKKEGEEEEEKKEDEDEDEERAGKEEEGVDKKEKEGVGDKNSEKEVEWGDSGDSNNCVRLQGDAIEGAGKEEKCFEISEEEETLIRTEDDKELLGFRKQSNDEQHGQICDAEGESGKNEAEEKDTEGFGAERQENSQLLKDIGLQVFTKVTNQI